MIVEIKKCRTQETQCTVEIDCDATASPTRKLGAAIESALEGDADLSGANLRDAYLRGANLHGANLSGANLRDAYLRDAYLSGANLSGANLRDANLSGAHLRSANLSGADLSGAHLHSADLSRADLRSAYLSSAYLGDQWIVQGPARSDGYFFFFMRLKDEESPMVRAGCRWLSMPAAREHWLKTRGGTPLGAETTAILDYLESVARIRGLE